MYLISEGDKQVLDETKGRKNACQFTQSNTDTPNFTEKVEIPRKEEIIYPHNVEDIAGPSTSTDNLVNVSMNTTKDATLASLGRRHRKLIKTPTKDEELSACRQKLLQCHIKNWQTSRGAQYSSTPIKSDEPAIPLKYTEHVSFAELPKKRHRQPTKRFTPK